jgi:hypothetical protein
MTKADEIIAMMKQLRNTSNLDGLILTGDEWGVLLEKIDSYNEALEKICECSRSWGGTSWIYNKAGLIADAALKE